MLEVQGKSQGRSSKPHSTTLDAQRSLSTCFRIVHRPFLHHASRRLQKASPHILPEVRARCLSQGICGLEQDCGAVPKQQGSESSGLHLSQAPVMLMHSDTSSSASVHLAAQPARVQSQKVGCSLIKGLNSGKLLLWKQVHDGDV